MGAGIDVLARAMLREARAKSGPITFPLGGGEDTISVLYNGNVRPGKYIIKAGFTGHHVGYSNFVAEEYLTEALARWHDRNDNTEAIVEALQAYTGVVACA